jgi:hypothetical protein
MILHRILLSLIEGINSTNQPVVISWDEVKLWPAWVLEKLVDVGILVPTARAKSLECCGCEHRCFMEIMMQKNKNEPSTRFFIVCNDPEMQSQIGRIEIPSQRLQQWQCAIQQLVKVTAKLLGIEDKVEIPLDQSNIKIGMLKGSKGRRWVSLKTNPLSLEINNQTMLLEEVLFFEGNQLIIDKSRVNEQLNKAPQSRGKAYAPSTNKREESKRRTLAMRKNWNDEYVKLKRNHPDKSAVWCSIQIAKMPISQGKDAKTILRYMK